MYKKTIMEIFNEPDYEQEREHHDKAGEDLDLCSNSLPADLVDIFKTKKPVKLCKEVIDDCLRDRAKRRTLTNQKRVDTLYGIGKFLSRMSGVLEKSKDDILLFADYFDHYCDLMFEIPFESNLALIVLSDNCPLFPVAATVPAALASGYSIIIVAPETKQNFFLFLEAIFSKCSLPKGTFKVVTAPDETDVHLLHEIDYVFFCGSYPLVQNFYKNTTARCFKFFCPNQTSAFVLESADLNAAVDKIIAETWGKKYPVFAVSNVVVQESIYQEFLEKLKHKMSQFISENKYSSKFKDEMISEKVESMIAKALSAGASIVEATGYGKWHPTVVVNYQCQDLDQDVPVLKLLLCRTAKEGVALLNNCRHTLGTSVWSEIISQALEISSQLISTNVWVNCHGVFHAGVPFQLSGLSGNCVLGGFNAVFDYPSWELKLFEEELEDMEPCLDGNEEAAVLAQQAFTTWQNNTNRRECLRQIAPYRPDFHRKIHAYAWYNYFTESSFAVEFSVLYNQIPIGVILLIILTGIDKDVIATVISVALASGNVIIVVLRQADRSVEELITDFNKFLPKNVLNLIIGVKYGIHLASHPSVQAVWLCPGSEISRKFLKTIKKCPVRIIKEFYVLPSYYSPCFLLRKCLREKIVWLTKKDQFP